MIRDEEKSIGNSADKAGICVIGYMGAAPDYFVPRFIVVRGRYYSNLKSGDFDTD